MTAYFRWEENLLPLALKAFEPNHSAHTHNHISDPLLDQAYRHCEEVTRTNSKTFFMASGLFPAEKKRSIRALYAFCRVTDDIVDYGGQDCDHQQHPAGEREDCSRSQKEFFVVLDNETQGHQ
ncbi:MAG: All-trans-phytoene synthase [Syntrophus sp. PtaB.Bin138]|nr:MAG: All-trans-phytoene synthase [Syntrophus sp. PtaB.Bin138]